MELPQVAQRVVVPTLVGRAGEEPGWVEGPARGYVSRGLGVTSLPVRINCPAELTILDLEPAS